MNFITTLVEHLSDAESPNSYIVWSGLSTLSAVLRDNVFFKFKHGTIYPNIYTIIVAGSSATRKDLPIRIAEQLIRDVGNTKVISGRASIQAVMKTLSENYTNEKGHRLKGASGILLSKELSDLIVDDPVAMKVITDWYDCHDHWDNNLVGSGVSKLENLCVTILAASNDILFQDVFKNSEIYGGLLARSFIVSESRRKKKNSRMYDDVGETGLYPSLLEHLRELTKCKGQVEITDNARRYYDDWYNSIEDDKFDRAGVIARMHTGVLKVSILLAAAREDFKMTVREADVEHSLDLCLGLVKNYKQITVVSGKSELANPMNLILAELIKEKDHCIQRRVLIQRLLGTLDSSIMDRCTETLIDAEYLTVTAKGGVPAYKLTDKFLVSYEKEATPMKMEKTAK
jgi:hypothetical protein